MSAKLHVHEFAKSKGSKSLSTWHNLVNVCPCTLVHLNVVDLPGLGCLLVGLVTMVSAMCRIQGLPASMS